MLNNEQKIAALAASSAFSGGGGMGPWGAAGAAPISGGLRPMPPPGNYARNGQPLPGRSYTDKADVARKADAARTSARVKEQTRKAILGTRQSSGMKTMRVPNTAIPGRRVVNAGGGGIGAGIPGGGGRPTMPAPLPTGIGPSTSANGGIGAGIPGGGGRPTMPAPLPGGIGPSTSANGGIGAGIPGSGVPGGGRPMLPPMPVNGPNVGVPGGGRRPNFGPAANGLFSGIPRAFSRLQNMAQRPTIQQPTRPVNAQAAVMAANTMAGWMR